MIKVFKVEKQQEKLGPGEVSTRTGFLNIGCADSTVRLSELQLEGKKRCEDVDLINGFRSEISIS